MARRKRFLDENPGGYDPLAETARRFEVEPLSLRPPQVDQLQGIGGPSKAPSMRSGRVGTTARAAAEQTESAAAVDRMLSGINEAARDQLAGLIAKDPEWFHPVGGGVKLREPFSSLTSTKVPTPGSTMRPDKPMSPEDFELGSYLFPLYGDRSIAGQTLLDVNGQPLKTPQKLGGGGRFMQENEGRLWASEQGKATTAGNKVRALEEQSGGKPVYGFHVAMGPTSGDFAKLTTRPLLQLTNQEAISEAAARAFDARMGKGWPGIKNVDENWLETAAGGDRANLAKVMQLGEFQKQAGFPNVAAVRKATTEPELMNVPTLTSGMSVGRFAPGGEMVPQAGTHESYNTDWLGEHVGNMGQVPLDLMLQDFMKTQQGVPIPNVGYSIERKMPVQEVTRQWQDTIMPWWMRRNDQ